MEGRPDVHAGGIVRGAVEPLRGAGRPDLERRRPTALPHAQEQRSLLCAGFARRRPGRSVRPTCALSRRQGRRGLSRWRRWLHDQSRCRAGSGCVIRRSASGLGHLGQSARLKRAWRALWRARPYVPKPNAECPVCGRAVVVGATRVIGNRSQARCSRPPRRTRRSPLALSAREVTAQPSDNSSRTRAAVNERGRRDLHAARAAPSGPPANCSTSIFASMTSSPQGKKVSSAATGPERLRAARARSRHSDAQRERNRSVLR